MSASSYVTAFRGARDEYQLPVALDEAGVLESFITDYYHSDTKEAWVSFISRFLPQASRARVRWSAAISPERVTSLYSLLSLQLCAQIAHALPKLNGMLDDWCGYAARQRARKTGAGLFLYNPYAPSAFKRHSGTKILFQMHPHVCLESRILHQDERQFFHLGMRTSTRIESATQILNPQRARADDAWRIADRIVAASSFTKRSLVESGCPESKIHVIPYGTHSGLVTPRTQPTDNRPLSVIFVGNGIQRKGLHHLLLAWEALRPRSSAQLKIVCRAVEPWLLDLAGATSAVEIFHGVPKAELQNLLASADLFCMPSLIEGFGHAYLDALAHGTPVLGTENTGLPDLGSAEDGIFLCDPGSVDLLAQTLDDLLSHPARLQQARAPAVQCAQRWTWPRFRKNLASVARECSAF